MRCLFLLLPKDEFSTGFRCGRKEEYVVLKARYCKRRRDLGRSECCAGALSI